MKLGSKEDIQQVIERAKNAGYDGEIRSANGKTTVKFSYKGMIDAGKERVIKLLAKNHKLDWYAQGYCFKTRVRDICFDMRG